LLGILRAWSELLTRDDDAGEEEAFMPLTGFVPCPECGGARLKPAARAVRFAGNGIHELTALNVGQAAKFFERLIG
jgi:excinuclease UvrABC ATPase subunit